MAWHHTKPVLASALTTAKCESTMRFKRSFNSLTVGKTLTCYINDFCLYVGPSIIDL